MKYMIMLIAFAITPAAAQYAPYVDPYFKTLPQMNREWEREKYDRKMIDYQVDKQIESDRQLQRDQEFDRQLDRLRRGY